MRLLALLMCLVVGTVAACAYDPLGVEPAVETDAGNEPDGGDSDDGGDVTEVDLTMAASVQPGCASADGWCERTPMFRADVDAPSEWPGYLNAVAATSPTDVWVAGQNFQILRWTGETWVREHESFGEAKALWVDSAGNGIAVGSDLGSPRKRRVLVRSPEGTWTPLGVPDELQEGELLDVWALVTREGARFWATTGTPLLMESDHGGNILGVELAGRADAIVGVADESGEVELFLGGRDGIGRRDTANELHPESVSAKAQSFFWDSDVVVAVGSREIWSRDLDPEPVWVKTTPVGLQPLAACRSAVAGGVARVAAAGATVHRNTGGSWVMETVTAPDDAVITACATLPLGGGWAVGYVPASDATGRPTGFVLEQKVP